MSARDGLLTALKAIIGTDAHVIGVEDNKDELDRITIVVKQRTIQRLPDAPLGSLRIDYVLSVTHPATDPAKAETALDDYVPSLLADMAPHAWFGWEQATKFLDGQNLGYDIDCYVLAGPRGEEQD